MACRVRLSFCLPLVLLIISASLAQIVVDFDAKLESVPGLDGGADDSEVEKSSSVKNEGFEMLPTAEKFVSAHSHNRLSSNFMLSLYQNLSRGLPLNRATGRHNHWRNLRFADTVRTFAAIGSYESRQLHLYKFNLSQIGSSEVLQAAELHFWLPPSWSQQQELYTVSVASGAVGAGLTYASSIPIITPSFSNQGLAIVDVTLPIRDWQKGFIDGDYRRVHEHTLDLAILASGRRKGFSRSKLLRQLERIYENEDMENQQQQTPDVILVTYSEAGGEFLNATSVYGDQLSRSKRSTRSHETFTSNSSACLRKELLVDFPALGWGEWVVYPTLFNAFQCAGKCSGISDSRHNPTNHAIVQSLVRLVSRRDLPISCCTPTKLSPLSILYLEKGSVVIKHHEDMIVEECGCM